ncbi:uncharacterized protein LOC116015975 [Ipomoea triloba]|uniref:uncharacterized protein LOC116015975 n=1 Tax=Ipomoea triloba TaxID=35885 RepID=UPI00125E5C77|nr:uncharacterized protein LOC116015975 [Ipomoea triloba]
MEFPREGLSNNRPPALSGTNYSYWKARMKIYILAQGERVWRAVENEWKHPLDDNNKAKGHANWSEEELKEFNYNSKAMNAIYGAVSEETFKLIAATNVAKTAWDILCDHHEGNSTVKQSKLQMIQTQFENLKMEEEENITQFNGRILEIVGEAYNLGEPIPENRLVKKVLRSLPERFMTKVIAIQESKDLNTCKLSDLMGNLKTYELEMLQNKKPNGKGIAFQSKQDTNSDEDTEKMEESIAVLTKNFNRVLKKFNKFRNKNKSFSNNQGSPSFAQNQSVNPKKEGNPNLDGIQCYECKGYGHIQSECPNYLRRKNKTYVATLSDDSDSEEENNFVAFFTNHEDDDESKEGMQDLLNSYKQLHAKWEEIIKVNLNLMQENHFLKSEKEKEILLHKETQEKLMKLLEEGDKLLQEIRRLTESAVQPDLATRNDSAVKNREVLQHHFQHRRRIRCYYCHRLGHIKAHCYKRQNDLHNRIWAKQEQKPAQKVWVRKNQTPVTAYTSKISKETSVWYFDSGCSRHMTGNPNNLEDVHYKNEGHVIFGDGERGQIIASGTLNVHGLPRLPRVFLVQGLKANLISISQLCEDELRVEFSKENCKVYNQGHECVMMGKMSSDKCYTWDSHLTCNQVTIDQTLLWHQCMGHINFHDRKKGLKRGAYRGIPNLDIDENRKYDACLENKMTRSSHKRTLGVHTSRIMELLHMDPLK